MTENVYAPPKANLAPVNESDAARFYVVSSRKFLILFFATLGMYQFYWFYKNWALYKRSTGESIWPVPRAIFGVFFVHALFRNVEAHNEEHSEAPWDRRSNALAVVVFLLASNGLDRLSNKSIGMPYTGWLSLLILIPLGLSVLSAQGKINARCGDPSGKSNNDLTGANIGWCVAGAFLWILVLFGLFAPSS
jgi:hypothetical protein